MGMNTAAWVAGSEMGGPYGDGDVVKVWHAECDRMCKGTVCERDRTPDSHYRLMLSDPHCMRPMYVPTA